MRMDIEILILIRSNETRQVKSTVCQVFSFNQPQVFKFTEEMKSSSTTLITWWRWSVTACQHSQHFNWIFYLFLTNTALSKTFLFERRCQSWLSDERILTLRGSWDERERTGRTRVSCCHCVQYEILECITAPHQHSSLPSSHSSVHNNSLIRTMTESFWW